MSDNAKYPCGDCGRELGSNGVCPVCDTEEAMNEVKRLRAALDEIAEYPSSQPAALNMPEDRWQAHRAQQMQGIAWRALNTQAQEAK